MTERLEAPDASALVAEPEEPFPNHIEQRTIVLAEQRVLYLPVPKAGWTTIGWILAEVAGLPSDLFEHSILPGVSTSLTIHDMNLWGPGYRLADYEGEERERILTEEGWFRFSVVRNPSPRLWSGWQSKLLLREPRFFEMFWEEPWFPRIPEQPEDMVEDFRRFASAVAAGDAVDVHWAIQSELLDRLPIEHVGRLEKLDETLALLREHVGGANWPTEQRQENRTPVPLPPAAYDEEAAAALNGHYAEDFERYGYEPVTPAADAAGMKTWSERVAPLLPIIKDTIDKHARIGQLHQVARRVQFLEERLENRSSRQVGHANSPILTNLENHTDFNVVWGWSEADTTPGFTAVVRAKNEADPLPWVLRPSSAPSSGSCSWTTARRTARLRSRGAWPRSAAPPSAWRCTPIPSRSRAAARSTSGLRPSRCTASSISTTGRSRRCAPATRSSGTRTWCSPTRPPASSATSPGNWRRTRSS